MKNLNLELLTYLVVSNDVILRGHILNVFKARFSNLVLYVVLSYDLLDILLLKIYVYLKYLLNYWIQNNSKCIIKKCIIKNMYYQKAMVIFSNIYDS